MADAILGNFAISKKVAPIFEIFPFCFYIIYMRYMRESTNNFVTKKTSKYGREQYSRDTAQGRTADAS